MLQQSLQSWPCCCRKRPKAADWDTVEATPAMNSWEATPGATPAAHWDATPGATPGAGSRWDATPTPGRPADGPTPRRNRWDETPTPGRVSPPVQAASYLIAHKHSTPSCPKSSCSSIFWRLNKEQGSLYSSTAVLFSIHTSHAPVTVASQEESIVIIFKLYCKHQPQFSGTSHRHDCASSSSFCHSCFL